MDIFRFVANSRKIAGALALSGAVLGTGAAMAESRASGEIATLTAIAQTDPLGASGKQDESFRNQFRAWQAHDAPRAQAAARLSVNTMPTLANIAIQTDSGLGHVTFGRALDAEGRPIDLSRIRSPGTDFRAGPCQDRWGQSQCRRACRFRVRTLTSGFGTRQHPIYGGRRAHSGIDLAAPAGTPIYATADGMVGRAQWQGGYGLFVEMEHGGGLATRYGHMSRLNVAAGQQVSKGDIIGYVGSTGLSTGPHLHYEIRVNGQAVNPVSRGRR